jgi:hypothetical protein
MSLFRHAIHGHDLYPRIVTFRTGQHLGSTNINRGHEAYMNEALTGTHQAWLEVKLVKLEIWNTNVK